MGQNEEEKRELSVGLRGTGVPLHIETQEKTQRLTRKG